MATSDLLNKLRTDITDTYTSINNLGGTIPEHKNTENIAPAIESIYNKLPKVSGTGTDLSLSPTLEARLGLMPRGNTEQDGTPTPSNPIMPKVVTGENSVKVENRNLLSSEFEQGARNNTDGTTLITSNNYVRTINKIDVQDNTQYIVSVDGVLKSGDVHFYNNDTFLSKTNTTSAFTTPDGCNKINIQFFDANGISVENMGNAQLEKGTTATPYVEHKEQNYPINLGNIELVEIGDYADYIEGTPDNWVKKEVIGKVILDGSEYWSVSGTNTSGYNRFTSGVIYTLIKKSTATSEVANVLSNYFVKKSADNTYQRINGISVGTNGNLYIYDNDFKEYTVEQFKNWLTTHNALVYYQLATPTDVPITDTTLINQLNTLYYAHSYDDETNISTSCEDGNMPIKINASALKGI